MTGLNDGLSQMIPFKYFLYNAYKNGDFFYSESFGLGAGIFSQLGYYFSTSLVFLVTVLITLLLEKLHVIGEPDLFYWINIILVVSIMRMTCILAIATYYFRLLNFKAIPAFLGACIYGTSIIYFRHVTYWDFFADAMLFFPLLLIGVEKVMRGQKVTFFIVAVALNMIDNFYFAYVNFLLTFIYIIFRWVLPLHISVLNKWHQVKLFTLGGLTGFGISAPFFIPSVYGYLNNYRPSYEDAIPLFGAVDNLLLNGRIVVLPTFVLVCMLVFRLYKDRHFLFFASLTGVLCVMHYSPFIGSAFNGFSAPQYRWEYFLMLAAGGVTAAGIQQFSHLSVKNLSVAASVASGLYIVFYVVDPKLTFTSVQDSYMAILAGCTIMLLFCCIWLKKQWMYALMVVFLLFSTVFTANMFQAEKLTYRGKGKEPSYGITKEYIMSEEYYGIDQRALISELQSVETDPFARIDWMVETRNNTPIVQDFKGMSVYSSILNENLLLFYLRDLEIDMGRESVSRYASLGDRANLYSMLNGNYYIADDRRRGTIPFGFTEAAKVGDYTAYQNDYVLPFVRTTSTVYSEEDLKEAPALVREQAMLQGIVLPSVGNEQVPVISNRIDQAIFEPVNATYAGGVLKVMEEEGGIDLKLSNNVEWGVDSYLSFFIKRKENDKDYLLAVNDFVTERKKNDSIYRTQIDKLTIRIPTAETLAIRLPKGTYQLDDFALYTEDYSILKAVKEQSKREPQAEATWEGGKVNISYDNSEGRSHMVIPVPYEKGWTATINGKRQNIIRANYAFTGLEIQPGQNDIVLTYRPPFFLPALLTSLIAILLTLFFLRRR